MILRIRRSADRGRTRTDWLDSRHTFSFAEYVDPAHMGFRALRVINEDRVAPATGFPMHFHRDMEILTWVIEGALEHRDSLGNGSIIRPGDIQRMTAGRGIEHSERNPSDSETTHLLQIWIFPDRRGLEPGYEQRSVLRSQGPRLIASPDGAAGSVRLHQDARVYAVALDGGEAAEARAGPSRHFWVQVARGKVRVGGDSDSTLEAGDGAAISGTDRLSIVASADTAAEALVFDLA